MTESELNDLVHRVADDLDRNAPTPVDRVELNVSVSALVQQFGITIEED